MGIRAAAIPGTETESFTDLGDDDDFADIRKALVGDEPSVQRSNLTDTEEMMASLFGAAGTIYPSINPLLLVRWYQRSSTLQQLVDVMVENTFGGGWRLEPVFDLDGDDAWNIVRASVIAEREISERELAATEKRPPEAIEEPTDADIDDKMERLKEDSWRQRQKAMRFFRNCNSKRDILDILMDMGEDREVVGWGCFEVRRNNLGEPARIDVDKSWTFRGRPLDKAIKTRVRIQETDITWSEEEDHVRYRILVQVSPTTGEVTYFKEYGDRRIVSAKTGNVVEKVEQLPEGEVPATELLWFPLRNPESAMYGLPRYAGNINSVVGSWNMEIVNLLYFDNKAIPPLVILVSGGRLAGTLKTKIQKAIRNHIKGTGNFHGILFIEAESPTTAAAIMGQAQAAQVKVEFKPLTEAFFTEQMFGEYDQANIAKVRSSFRIPRILTGEAEKDNRATAESTLIFFDGQVARPEREAIERTINRNIMLDLGVTLWKWRLNQPQSINPTGLIEAVNKLTEHVITPAEGRKILSGGALGVELDKVEDAQWVTVPLKQFLAMQRQKQGTGEEGDEGEETDADMQKFKSLLNSR